MGDKDRLMHEYSDLRADFRHLATYRFGLLLLFLGYSAVAVNSGIAMATTVNPQRDGYIIVASLGLASIVGTYFVIVAELRLQTMYLLLLERLTTVERELNIRTGVFIKFVEKKPLLYLRHAAMLVYGFGFLAHIVIIVYGVIRALLFK